MILDIVIETNSNIEETEVIALYHSNQWSAAEKPKQLMAALLGSHTLISARVGGKLVGLANAISDGYLVVYYPHMLVNPAYQRRSIGKKMMVAMQKIYGGFHQQMLTADGEAIEFYKALGFENAGNTQSMWIYAGTEH